MIVPAADAPITNGSRYVGVPARAGTLVAAILFLPPPPSNIGRRPGRGGIAKRALPTSRLRAMSRRDSLQRRRSDRRAQVGHNEPARVRRFEAPPLVPPAFPGERGAQGQLCGPPGCPPVPAACTPIQPDRSRRARVSEADAARLLCPRCWSQQRLPGEQARSARAT